MSRLLLEEDIQAFCDRVVVGCGVLLLPADVYDHGPSTAGRHFRLVRAPARSRVLCAASAAQGRVPCARPPGCRSQALLQALFFRAHCTRAQGAE